MLGDLAQGGMLGGAAEATQVVLLTGSMNKAARQEAMLKIVTGEAGIVTSTLSMDELRERIADGTIDHALHLAVIALAMARGLLRP